MNKWIMRLLAGVAVTQAGVIGTAMATPDAVTTPDEQAWQQALSANTLEAYRRDLTDFSADLTEHGNGIAKAESDDIRDYLGRLAARGFSASSVARRLSAIRQLYRFLYAEGNRKDDPAAAIEGPKRGRQLPKVLSVSHVDQLLATDLQLDARVALRMAMADWRTRSTSSAWSRRDSIERMPRAGSVRRPTSSPE